MTVEVKGPKNGTHYTAIDRPPPVVLGPFEPSRTRQSEAKAADINEIMRKYDKTGLFPQGQREALYVDVSEMPDYRTSLDTIRKADELFMQLPAVIRTKFDNDAAMFLDWTSDPDNREEMIELGMLPKPEVLAPTPVSEAPVVEPTPVPEAPVVEP